MMWPVNVVTQGLLSLSVPSAILIGFLVARFRVLGEPGRHLGLLRGTAAVGITVGWRVVCLWRLAHVGVWELNGPQGTFMSFPHMVTGLFCGLGYIALIVLIARRMQEHGTGACADAVAATGKRFLSAYLAQSVLCAPLLPAWGLGMGAHLRPWSMAMYALGIWLLAVIGAAALEQAGRRGPAEVLLRRLAYWRSGAPAPSGPGTARPLLRPQGRAREKGACR